MGSGSVGKIGERDEGKMLRIGMMLGKQTGRKSQDRISVTRIYRIDGDGVYIEPYDTPLRMIEPMYPQARTIGPMIRFRQDTEESLGCSVRPVGGHPDMELGNVGLQRDLAQIFEEMQMVLPQSSPDVTQDDVPLRQDFVYKGCRS
eukprot:gene10494-biopygen2997